MNCTHAVKFPKLGLVIGNVSHEIEPDDYMDRSHDPKAPKGVDTCWSHLMPVGDTGRGPIFVLGMPFLRAFYTIYDVKASQIGFAKAKHSSQSSDNSKFPTGEVP